MIIADALDSKHLYEDVFQDYYQWGEKLRLEGLPQSPFGPALKPFQVTHTTDMKAACICPKKEVVVNLKRFFIICAVVQKTC